MSVKTIADEKLESAKKNVDAAIKDLSGIVVDKVEGHADYYVGGHKNQLILAMAKLLEVQTLF